VKDEFSHEEQISMHVSSSLLHPVAPWIKTWPKKIVDRVPVYAWPFATVSIIYGTVVWADAADAQEQYDHRY